MLFTSFVCSLQQAAHNALDIEFLEVHVGLPTAHKHDRGSAAVHHGQGSSNLHSAMEVCIWLIFAITTCQREINVSGWCVNQCMTRDLLCPVQHTLHKVQQNHTQEHSVAQLAETIHSSLHSANAKRG